MHIYEVMYMKKIGEEYVGGFGVRKGKKKRCDYIIISKNKRN